MFSDSILKDFPKKRTELPKEYRDIYEKNYEENRKGETKMTFLSQKMENWLHKEVAKSSESNKKTLELGAGTLNQLVYEKAEIYDIVEPFKLLYEGSSELIRIRNIYDDISDISLNEKYDRIISCATFEHILNLPEVIAKCCLLLNDKGGLYASIPNEGRFLWKLGYKLTTGLEYKRRYNLDYDVLMKHEHVNDADEIESLLKYFFEKVSVKLFGINKTFSFYRFLECKNPRIDKAEEYLERCKHLDI